jgi:hypothetical protein
VEELQVPTRRIHVEITVTTGQQMAGVLYALDSPYHPTEADDLLQLLNDERAFLPFGADFEERRTLLNKNHVLRVRLPSPAGTDGAIDMPPREEFRPSPVGDSGRLLLSDGSTIMGRPVVETPWSSSRLLDKLNQAPRFILVMTDDGLEFLRRDHLVRVD